MQRYVVGVDEAGRGPLAGPVVVGVVMVPERFAARKHFPGVADSKKLSEKKREEIFTLLQNKSQTLSLRYVAVFASATLIDTKGISYAVRQAVYTGVRKLAPEGRGVRVLLDGLLQAPATYVQKTIVRGDATEPVISLASIVAKVSRDRYMVRLAKKYPCYGFERHKGYGTRVHQRAIRTHGVCPAHRRSFIHEPLVVLEK